MEEDKTLWFESKQVDEVQAEKIQKCRDAFKELGKVLATNLDGGRRTSMVWSHLEEAQMMATKSITHG